jgi:hypothetical protein
VYRFVQLWIPPQTTEEDPATVTIELERGVIVAWDACFPDGCADLVHLAVHHYERRILPRNESESLFWNDHVFHIPEHYVLDEEPYELELRGWSDDDAYYQYIVLGVDVGPIEEVTVKELLSQFLGLMVGGR